MAWIGHKRFLSLIKLLIGGRTSIIFVMGWILEEIIGSKIIFLWWLIMEVTFCSSMIIGLIVHEAFYQKFNCLCSFTIETNISVTDMFGLMVFLGLRSYLIHCY